MFRRILFLIAIIYATASAAWSRETAKEEMERLKDALTTRMKSQGKTVDTEHLIMLYALFKQATVGDKPADLSAGMDPKKHVLYTAWAKLAGMPIATAVEQYKAIVKALGDVE